jgi:hypothetical protein
MAVAIANHVKLINSIHFPQGLPSPPEHWRQSAYEYANDSIRFPPGLENLPPLTQIGGSLPPRPPTWKALTSLISLDLYDAFHACHQPSILVSPLSHAQLRVYGQRSKSA